MRYNQSYKPLRLVLFATMMCVTFASCSNLEEDITPSSSTVSRVPLSVSAVIQSGDISRKAGIDAETFERGDTIGLYILDSAGNVYNESSDSYNVPAVFNGTYFNLMQDVYLTDSVAYVYAYYPYSSDTSDNSAVIDISSGETDVLVAESPATASRDDPQAYLTFSHSLARVTLSVKLSEEIWEVKPTSASIYWADRNDVAELRFFDQLEAYETSYEEYVTITRTVTCSETLSSTESTDIDILLYPSEVDGKTASLVIDGDIYEFEIPTTLAETWEAGGQYIYHITITKVAATKEDDTDDSAEDTTDESGNVSGYDAVDLGLSVRWATCNVGAESPEDYGNYYAWGEIKTKDTYTTENCLTYSVEVDSSGNTEYYSIVFDDISGGAEYDAATANWGGSWRMPTYAELQELVDDCAWTWTTLNDVNGYLVTGSNGNSIFLPAAGYHLSWRFVGDGSSGCYWSSTPFGGNYKYAYLLEFTESDLVYKAYTHEYGYSVRPVSE